MIIQVSLFKEGLLDLKRGVEVLVEHLLGQFSAVEGALNIIESAR